MPVYRNCYTEEVDGKYIEKPLMVTISLEEYRSLVLGNAQYAHRIDCLENRLLEEIEKKQKGGFLTAEEIKRAFRSHCGTEKRGEEE